MRVWNLQSSCESRSALFNQPPDRVSITIIAPAIERRSAADRELRRKTEPNEPLNEGALQLIVSRCWLQRFLPSTPLYLE